MNGSPTVGAMPATGSVTRRTSRAVTALLASAAIALTGCSGSGGSGSSDGGSGDSAPGNEFTAAGVSFEAPDGWEALDAEDAGVSGEDGADIAAGLGMTADQLQQTIAAVDLFVVDGEGPQDGFLSNINVLEQEGELPEDAQIESQFSAMGADVDRVTHEDSALGDVTAVAYTLTIDPNVVEGVSYLLARDGQVVTVTVSTPDRARSAEIGDAIIASLAEAG